VEHGLTFVHLSAQPEPFWSLKPLHTRPLYPSRLDHCNRPTYPIKVFTLSWDVDACQTLVGGNEVYNAIAAMREMSEIQLPTGESSTLGIDRELLNGLAHNRVKSVNLTGRAWRILCATLSNAL